MSGSLNKVFLVGNLTRDPELRFTATGAPVCSFDIAVNRKYKQGDDWKTDVSFFKIISWGKQGENCAKYLLKGKSALVEGRLQNRSYETQDGQKRTVTEIVADNVQFLGGKSGGQSQEVSGSQNGNYADNDDQVPF
jgi:single-strand DNA-binding protein